MGKGPNLYANTKTAFNVRRSKILIITALLAISIFGWGEPLFASGNVTPADTAVVIRSAIDSTLSLVLPADSLDNRPYSGKFGKDQVLDSRGSIDKPVFGEMETFSGERKRGRHYGHSVETEFSMYFRRNKTDIDNSYLWSREQQSDLLDFLAKDVVVDSIVVYGWASPEGDRRHNAWLSRERANAARGFILENAPQVDPECIIVSHQEENWHGLRLAVKNFYDGPDKEQLMEILENTELSDAQRERELKDLDGGKTFDYLLETLMKPLRCAVVIVYWQQDELKPVLFDETPMVSSRDADSEGLGDRAASLYGNFPLVDEWEKRTVVAVKTNVLYDALTIPNYAIEFPIGDRFSVQWEHNFPWWSTRDELKYCLQYLTLGGEFRWWFAPQPKPETGSRMLRDVLVGHYVGVYGMFCKTDIQWQDKIGMYQCYPVLSAGLTYGYSFPLTKHWNMELALSAGYARIPYQHYIPSDDWQILWRDRDNQGVLHYFGPTEVKVSLVRPIVIEYRKR